MPTIAAPGLVDFTRLNDTFCSRKIVGNLCVAVAGAGALGNEAVRILGLVGVGKITVIDPDLVAATDLTRSILLRGFVGWNKAEAMVQSAGSMFPDTSFVAFPCEVADVGFSELMHADVILGCTDSDLSRLELAYISTRLNIPVVDGGLSTADLAAGRVSHFPGAAGACYGCLLTGAKRAELLTRWQSPVSGCAHPPSEPNPEYASTPMMASVVAALQVETALRGREESPGEAWSWEVCIHPRPAVERLRLARAAGCPFHDPDSARQHPPGEACTVAEYLAPFGDAALLLLDWPVCVRARCPGCGLRWTPMCRLAFLNRRGACPGCGMCPVRAEESIGEIDAASPLAGLRFRQLGLSPSHPYTVRVGGGS